MVNQYHNRFEYLAALILTRETRSAQKTQNDLVKHKTDSLMQLWDGIKILLVDQGIMTEQDPFVTANFKKGRNATANNPIAVSKELVYAQEIQTHLSKLKQIDAASFFNAYGHKLKYSNKSAADFEEVTFNEEDSFEEQMDEDDLKITNPTNVIPETQQQQPQPASQNFNFNAALENAFTNFEQKQVDRDNKFLDKIGETVKEEVKKCMLNYKQELDNLKQQISNLTTIAQNAQSSANNNAAAIQNLNVEDISNKKKVIDDMYDKIDWTDNEKKKQLKDLVEAAKTTVMGDVNAWVKNHLENNAAEFRMHGESAADGARPRASTNLRQPLGTGFGQAPRNLYNLNRNNNQNERRQPFQVWGEAEPDTNLAPVIPRVYSFAVSRIPKNDVKYTTEWLSRELQRIHTSENTHCQVLETEIIPSTHEATSKTKTFKVLIKCNNGEVNADTFRNPKLWVRGLRAQPYRRPRNRTNDDDAVQLLQNEEGMDADENKNKE